MADVVTFWLDNKSEFAVRFVPVTMYQAQVAGFR
jgi:hypothetical protein